MTYIFLYIIIYRHVVPIVRCIIKLTRCSIIGGNSFARNRQHACRFVYHYYSIILVHYAWHILCLGFCQWVRLHIQSAKHMCKYRQTLGAACRIIMKMVAYLLLWRIAPPKFSHTYWFQAIGIGILQQFWRTTIARSSRWHCINSFAKYVD